MHDERLGAVRTVSTVPGEGTPPAPVTETHAGDGPVVS
jgi:hypothetical protein